MVATAAPRLPKPSESHTQAATIERNAHDRSPKQQADTPRCIVEPTKNVDSLVCLAARVDAKKRQLLVQQTERQQQKVEELAAMRDYTSAAAAQAELEVLSRSSVSMSSVDELAQLQAREDQLVVSKDYTGAAAVHAELNALATRLWETWARSAGGVESSVVGVQFRCLPAEGNDFAANNKHERAGSDVDLQLKEIQKKIDSCVAQKHYEAAAAAHAELDARIECYWAPGLPFVAGSPRSLGGPQSERSTLGLNELQPIVADCVAEKNYEGAATAQPELDTAMGEKCGRATSHCRTARNEKPRGSSLGTGGV